MKNSYLNNGSMVKDGALLSCGASCCKFDDLFRRTTFITKVLNIEINQKKF